MSILSGFKKVRRRIRLPNGYKLLSFWTSSQTVEMDDGTTLESNKAKWDDASDKKHEHTNKSALDSITSEKVSKWDTLAESNVTGVKGNTESSYRTGNVNLTPANIGALPTTGGTLTGNISFNMNSSTQTPLKIYGGDIYGQGISVGAGGATIVGGGESAKALESVVSATNEDLHLASDNNIYFDVNCNTIANRLQIVLDKSRNFYPATNNTGSVGTSSYKWANVYTSALNGTTISSNAKASSSVPGLMKLYTSTGTGTDGTMTQYAITQALSGKASASHTHSNLVYNISGTTGGSFNLSSYLNNTSINGLFLLAVIPASYYSPSVYIIYCYESSTFCKQIASIINSSPSNATLSYGSSSTILTVTTAQGITSDIRLIRLTH